jgi:hypothetical protein
MFTLSPDEPRGCMERARLRFSTYRVSHRDLSLKLKVGPDDD